jgi:hypothetical protein
MAMYAFGHDFCNDAKNGGMLDEWVSHLEFFYIMKMLQDMKTVLGEDKIFSKDDWLVSCERWHASRDIDPEFAWDRFLDHSVIIEVIQEEET